MNGLSDIAITSEYHSPNELKALIEQPFGSESINATFHVRRLLRGGDSVILVALVTSAAGVITALINVILTIYSKNVGAIIKIRTKEGAELAFPASASREMIEAALSAHHELAVNSISVIRPDS